MKRLINMENIDYYMRDNDKEEVNEKRVIQ